MTENSYIIVTDSSCDMPAEVLREWGVPSVRLTFRFDGDEADVADGDVPLTDFYARMRAGGVAKTSAASIDAYTEAFRPLLEGGQDLLYIAFSSGLSSTRRNGEIASEDLVSVCPGRRVIVIDTLAASAGMGMLLYLAVRKRAEGASLDETAAYIEDTKLHLCHWFTVDDLVYLKRGGRISAATAIVGGMLQIKPVMHMDNEGHLVSVGKVRGRKASLQALADKYVQTCTDKSAPVFISHADCSADADYLSSLIVAAGGPAPTAVYVGPVIGAHCGPGTVALFFIGTER